MCIILSTTVSTGGDAQSLGSTVQSMTLYPCSTALSTTFWLQHPSGGRKSCTAVSPITLFTASSVRFISSLISEELKDFKHECVYVWLPISCPSSAHYCIKQHFLRPQKMLHAHYIPLKCLILRQYIADAVRRQK